jgi:hypothetical protein
MNRGRVSADGSTITTDDFHVTGGSGCGLLDAQPSIAFTERVLRGLRMLMLESCSPTPVARVVAHSK